MWGKYWIRLINLTDLIGNETEIAYVAAVRPHRIKLVLCGPCMQVCIQQQEGRNRKEIVFLLFSFVLTKKTKRKSYEKSFDII